MMTSKQKQIVASLRNIYDGIYYQEGGGRTKDKSTRVYHTACRRCGKKICSIEGMVIFVKLKICEEHMKDYYKEFYERWKVETYKVWKKWVKKYPKKRRKIALKSYHRKKEAHRELRNAKRREFYKKFKR